MKSVEELLDAMWNLAADIAVKDRRGQELLAMITDLEKAIPKPPSTQESCNDK